jgi:molybdopterin/thiamine biosynthesis adenylyltransferase
MHYGLATELDDESGLVWPLCELMDGTRGTDEVIAAVARDQKAPADEVAEVLDFLVASGWVEDAGAALPSSLSAREAERYKRSAQYLGWIDDSPRSSPYEHQARLKASRVVVLGVGGTGSAAAASLAACGIGQLHFLDMDVVELGNLVRQLLFTEADIGKPKAEVAADRLRALNSDIEITAAVTELTGPDSIAEAARGADVFLLCADKPQGIADWASQAALRLGVPWVMGMYDGPKLQVATFIPGVTGCMECLKVTDRERLAELGLDDLPEARSFPDFNPVMAPTAQMTGHFAAMEVIFLLLGLRVGTAGRMLHRNFLDPEHQYFIDATRRPDCAMCGEPVAVTAGTGTTGTVTAGVTGPG